MLSTSTAENGRQLAQNFRLMRVEFNPKGQAE